jgi:hypothetical protein
MKPVVRSSPLPRSGGLPSFAFGLTTALICLALIPEVSISSGMPKRQSDSSNSLTQTQVKWEIEPLLPKNFEEKKFVEANSDVPENPPDETKNFSFRDQQAAQPQIDPKLHTDQTPAVKGSDDTVKIVPTERESQPEPDPVNPSAEKPANELTPTAPSLASSSKTDLEKGLSEDGTHLKKGDDQGEESRTIALNHHQLPNDLSPNPSVQPALKKKQQQRPKLSPELIQGPLMRTSTTAPRIGIIAIESRLHPHGIYLQKMLKAIEEQWHQLALGSIRFMQKDRLPGTLTFRFTLLSTGGINNLSRLDSEGVSLAAELCRQAIASRAPFGNWTKDMISDFGKFDEITISFRYR